MQSHDVRIWANHLARLTELFRANPFRTREIIHLDDIILPPFKGKRASVSQLKYAFRVRLLPWKGLRFEARRGRVCSAGEEIRSRRVSAQKKLSAECRLATSLRSSLRRFPPRTTNEDFSCRSHHEQTLLMDFFHYLETRPLGRSRWNSRRCCVFGSLNNNNNNHKKKKNSCIFNVTVPRRALATKRMGRCCSVL